MEEFLLICQTESIDQVIRHYHDQYKQTLQSERLATVKHLLQQQETRFDLLTWILGVFEFNPNEWRELCWTACVHQKKQVLLEITRQKRISCAFYKHLFVTLCETNQIEMVQFLYILCPLFICASTLERAFQRSCQQGHLSLSKWLFRMEPNMCLERIIPSLFHTCMIHGRFEMSTWLYAVALKQHHPVTFSSHLLTLLQQQGEVF